MLKQIETYAAGNLARVQALSHARLSNYRSFFHVEVLGVQATKKRSEERFFCFFPLLIGSRGSAHSRVAANANLDFSRIIIYTPKGRVNGTD